jgi:hypothetical protein
MPGRAVPNEQENVSIGPHGQQREPIPSDPIWLLCPFTPKAARMGTRKRSQIYGPFGDGNSQVAAFSREVTEDAEKSSSLVLAFSGGRPYTILATLNWVCWCMARCRA